MIELFELNLKKYYINIVKKFKNTNGVCKALCYNNYASDTTQVTSGLEWGGN